MAIRVLVADDHQIIRQGLRLLFAAESDLELVGEAENGQQALDLCEQLRPDVVVMDIGMPRMDGFEATRRVTASHPEVCVIALSMHNDHAFMQGMKQAGAKGYVIKDSAFEELAGAIRAVVSGDTYFDD